MTPEDSAESQLESLQQRWESDPSPHLALQLADLYRQRGRLAEALPVLEKGLADHPDHVSVRVALGRYRLESEDAEAAAQALLVVVDKDPGHLVANKLLVRAYVALGDRQRAANRLELYAVLNDGDPELEALRDAVAGTAAETSLPEGGGEPFAAHASPAPPADLTTVQAPALRHLRGALDRAPFAEVLVTPLRAASLGGLFGPAFEPPDEPDVEVLDGAPIEVAGEGLTERGSSAADLDEVSPEFIDALIEQDPALEEPIAAETSETAAEPAEEIAADPEPAPVPEEIDRGSAATATLGALYLAQDHLDDAEATFEQVLVRDPEDLEARAGLEELARRRGRIRAAEAPAPVPEGDRGKKVELLKDYLGRIRAAADKLSV